MGSCCKVSTGKDHTLSPRPPAPAMWARGGELYESPSLRQAGRRIFGSGVARRTREPQVCLRKLRLPGTMTRTVCVSSAHPAGAPGAEGGHRLRAPGTRARTRSGGSALAHLAADTS